MNDKITSTISFNMKQFGDEIRLFKRRECMGKEHRRLIVLIDTDKLAQNIDVIEKYLRK